MNTFINMTGALNGVINDLRKLRLKCEEQTADSIQIASLVRELDRELDGVSLPASASSILNSLRLLVESSQDP